MSAVVASMEGSSPGIWMIVEALNGGSQAPKEKAGIIWVNCYDVGDMTQPWGGFKQSASAVTNVWTRFWR